VDFRSRQEREGHKTNLQDRILQDGGDFSGAKAANIICRRRSTAFYSSACHERWFIMVAYLQRAHRADDHGFTEEKWLILNALNR